MLLSKQHSSSVFMPSIRSINKWCISVSLKCWAVVYWRLATTVMIKQSGSTFLRLKWKVCRYGVKINYLNFVERIVAGMIYRYLLVRIPADLYFLHKRAVALSLWVLALSLVYLFKRLLGIIGEFELNCLLLSLSAHTRLILVV